MIAIVTGVLLVLVGLPLAIGGVELGRLGGSWSYAVLGLGFALTAGLLVAKRPAALPVFAAVLLGTLGWSALEVGHDWWQLVPRGDIVVPIGLWLLTPWIARSLGISWPIWRGARASLALALLAAGGVGIVAAVTPSNERHGRLPTAAIELAKDRGGVPAGDWHSYGQSGLGDRYAPQDGITPANVGLLERASIYHTGDLRRPGDPVETTFEVTPLKVGDTLYLCTPHNLVIALDAATGQERWRFDPKVPDETNRQHLTCRGVAYHDDPAAGGQPCAQRILMPTADARLLALDGATGAPCTGFGASGSIDLMARMPFTQPGFYYATSPPVVARGLVVIGGAVNDNVSTTEPSGVIRAYDVRSGALVWNFDTADPAETAPISQGETYTPNSPNSWTVSSVDAEFGLVYVPIGNQPPDQWGGHRGPEVERFSSSIAALELETGAVRWVFQTVHHDLWDMDVPAQPSLLDLVIDGATVPALVAPTKQGDVYVLDRRSGRPILPVSERSAPQGAAAGDWTAPTQPVSALSFEPPPLRGRDMWGVSLLDQLWCRVAFHRLRYEGRYTPPSIEGSLIYPGNFGVFNWGGIAVDPARQIMVGTPAYLAFTSRLIPRDDPDANLVSEGRPGLNENYGAPFAVELAPFVSPLGLPCQAPPWGTIAGADLRTGQIVWQHVNGTVRDSSPIPLPFELGVPDLGGPLLTAGGVAFNSGTLDRYVRAYDVTTGAELWRDRLPAGGQATPMSYALDDGRQMVVVIAGGHGSLGTKAGDAVIAYALPL